MVRLDFLDVETELGTAQIRKKIDDGVRMLERFARQYADHVKGNRVRLETFDSFHYPGMRAVAVAGFPMAIVEPSGAVDADPDANLRHEMRRADGGRSFDQDDPPIDFHGLRRAPLTRRPQQTVQHRRERDGSRHGFDRWMLANASRAARAVDPIEA